MTPRFSRQSRTRDTFVPAMPPAQPLDARLRVRQGPQPRPARSSPVRGGSACEARPWRRCPEQPCLNRTRRPTAAVRRRATGRRGCVGLKESGDETLAHDTCSPAHLSIPRCPPSPAQDHPLLGGFRLRCRAATCLAVSSQATGFQHLQCRRTLTSSKLADSICGCAA